MVGSSSWKKKYLKALKESDKIKLAKLVYATEEAIFLRSQELSNSLDGQKERNEIHEACANLLSIQITILGWPAGLL